MNGIVNAGILIVKVIWDISIPSPRKFYQRPKTYLEKTGRKVQ